MPTPSLRRDFTDSRTPGENELSAGEYNLNAARTDAAYAIIPRYPTFSMFNAAGNDIADDTGPVSSAIAAGIASGLPVIDNVGGTYKLTNTIDARCTVSGANQADDFKGIIGLGRNATMFKQYTNNIPIFRFSGRYFTVKGFTAGFNTIQTVAQTSGNVFDFEDMIFFCTFDDLLIQNGYRGINSKDGAKTDVGSCVFSNTFSNIRFIDNHYVHLKISASGGPSAGGTGNHMSNIYMSSDVDRMWRAIERFNGFEDVFDQLNIEHTTFEDCAIYDEVGGSLIINALHCEGLRFMCGSGERAMISTDGTGRARLDVGIDSCYFGPHRVASITRSGTTATATIDLLGADVPGHGLRAGDTVVVAGASQSQYNGTFTLTAVPSLTTVQYTVSGSPATPATIVSGGDTIVMSLGAALGPTGINIVTCRSGTELVDMDLRIRDVRVTGTDYSTRASMLRIASAYQAGNARVKLRNLSTRGQIDNAHLPSAIDVVAQSRTSNTVTTYTRIPHRLRAGNSVFLDTTLVFAVRTVASIIGPHAFTVTSAGADAALARAPGGETISLNTYSTTNRARSGNVATLTIGSHPLVVGMRIRVSGTPSAYKFAPDYAISAVTSTTISYVNVGADEATTADTAGSVMVLDSGLNFGYLVEPLDSLALGEADWLYSGCECLAVGTVNAGVAATQNTTHTGARVGDRIVWAPFAVVPDGLQIRPYVSAADTITWRVFNTTTGNIVSGVNLVTYKFSRS